MARIFKEQLERTTWQQPQSEDRSEKYQQFLAAIDQVYERVFLLWSHFFSYIEAHPGGPIEDLFEHFSDFNLTHDEKRFLYRIAISLRKAERQRQRLIRYAKKGLEISETDHEFATLLGAALHKKLTGHKPEGSPLFLDVPFVPGLLMTDARDTARFDGDAGSLRGWFYHNYSVRLGSQNVDMLFSRVGLSSHKLIIETEKSDRKTTLRHEQMHNYNLHFRDRLRFFNIHQSLWGEKTSYRRIARLSNAAENQDWELAIQHGRALIPAALAKAKEELSADFESSSSFRYIGTLILSTYTESDDESSYNPYPFLRDAGVKRKYFGQTEAGAEAYRTIVEEYNHQLKKQTNFLAKLFEASKQQETHYPDMKMRIQAFMQVTPMHLWDTFGRRVFRQEWSELKPVAEALAAEVIYHRKKVSKLAHDVEDSQRLFGKEFVSYYECSILEPILEQDQELKDEVTFFTEMADSVDHYIGKAFDMTRIEPQYWTGFDEGKLEAWEVSIEILNRELELERRRLEQLLVQKGLALKVYRFSMD